MKAIPLILYIDAILDTRRNILVQIKPTNVLVRAIIFKNHHFERLFSFIYFSDIDECGGWINTACNDYADGRPENSDVFCHNTQVSREIHTV